MALHELHRRGQSAARLWIIGSWDDQYRRKLDRLIARHALKTSVTFFGQVDDDTKHHYLAQAHLVVMTSVREGWGLVVSEANAVGTPGVVYDVPGLRDSTLHMQTGLVCSRNDPETLAENLLTLYSNRDFYARLRYNSWMMSRQLSWDQTARQAWAAIQTSLWVTP
jgi:glycosyltransferase involved in cell wall biosynthesis